MHHTLILLLSDSPVSMWEQTSELKANAVFDLNQLLYQTVKFGNRQIQLLKRNAHLLQTSNIIVAADFNQLLELLVVLAIFDELLESFQGLQLDNLLKEYSLRFSFILECFFIILRPGELLIHELDLFLLNYELLLFIFSFLLLFFNSELLLFFFSFNLFLFKFERLLFL